MNKHIILASGSPRRKELLGGLDLPFEVDTLNSFDEHWSPDTPHKQVPRLMSQGKSHGFHRPLEEDEILITADTMVFLSDLLLGKPHSRQQAIEMLQDLSGNTHEVITSVTLRDGLGHEETFEDSTLVTFRQLSLEEIEYYIDHYRPYDKAGAYGVQEWIGYTAITCLQGSFYNVMGFPVHKVYQELKKFLEY